MKIRQTIQNSNIYAFRHIAIIMGVILMLTFLTTIFASSCNSASPSVSTESDGILSDSSDESSESSSASPSSTTESLPSSAESVSSYISETSEQPTIAISPDPTKQPTPTETTTVEFTGEVGIWYSTWYAKLDPSTPGYTTANREPEFNTWIAWNIFYKPLGPDGIYETYDSLNEEVLSYHTKVMTDADIDFIIMDQTNNIDVESGYINARSIKMAQTIKKWNDTQGNKPLRYSSAIGAFQFTNNPASIETEAKILYDRYSSQSYGGSDYEYYLDGKPLLVVYAGNTAESLWTNYTGSKEYASKFTIRWANNASTAGYYGWAYNRGSVYDEEVVVVMPGWRNNVGAPPTLRYNGGWYENSWNVVLKAEKKPKIVVINSFNEYAERTAVWCADTTGLEGSPNELDRWINEEGDLDPEMYWNMTVDNIRKYKAMR